MKLSLLSSLLLTTSSFYSIRNCHGFVGYSNIIKFHSLKSLNIPSIRLYHQSKKVQGDRIPSPNDIEIPLDQLDIQYSRSSGPGGQNVNKLNTKAEIRFNIDDANWLEPEVKERLKLYQANKITKEGDIVVTAQEFR